MDIRILFRCDGSLNIGFGHLSRSLLIAKQIKKIANSKVFFAIAKHDASTKKIQIPFQTYYKKNNSYNNLNWLKKCIEKLRVNVLFLDVKKDISYQDLKCIKNLYNINIVTIDDFEKKRLISDLAFYTPIPQAKKIKWKKHKGKVLNGWQYSVVRKMSIKKINRKNNKINILISMGGSDIYDFTKISLSFLNKLDLDFKVNIIIGPGYKNYKELNELSYLQNLDHKIYYNPQNIEKIMIKNDIAIITFGQTSYEIAALKIPALYFCISKDHKVSSKLFEKFCFGKTIGTIGSINNKQCIKLIKKAIIENKDLKMNMYKKINFSKNLEIISKEIKMLVK